MASITPLFTLFFLLLSILSTTILAHPPTPSSHPKPAHDFIWSSCRATRYPPLCYRTLSGYGSKIGRSQRQLALTALAVSLSQARSVVRFVSQMKMDNKGIKQRELDAVKDCIDNMSDGVDQLTRSFSELSSLGHINGEDFMWHMSNVQTWVSSALTDESTCVDGLSDGHVNGGKVKGAIRIKVNRVAQHTSIALALVNHFVNGN